MFCISVEPSPRLHQTSRSAALATFALAAIAGPAAAQRETVLKQIDVPHNYYFREMYLPQFTSGPGWVTWSPDGASVIYAMAGSLWRQTLGSTEATQLTDGPGYDAQPDWSPDGRYVVFTSYRNDAVDLRILDLPAGVESSLLANRAVNLEPRWSPDGRTIAFVSTEYRGRWHLFTVSVGGGRLTNPPLMITTDRESGLPRYYYSRYDHFISPTWSPDGKWFAFLMTDAKSDEEEKNDKARNDFRWVDENLKHARLYAVSLEKDSSGKREPKKMTSENYTVSSFDWSPDGKQIVYQAELADKSGELRVFDVETKESRVLQKTANADEFWAAIPNEAKKETSIGRYNTKTFKFTEEMKIPQILLDSMKIWVDEKDAKIYFIYEGHLLSLPLKAKVTTPE